MLFPTPPFPESTTTMCFTPRSRSRSSAASAAGRAAASAPAQRGAPPPATPGPQRLSHPGPSRRRRRRRASGWGIPDRRRPDPPGRCWFPGSLQGDARAAARVPPTAANTTARRTRTAPHPSPSGRDPSATSAMAPPYATSAGRVAHYAHALTAGVAIPAAGAGGRCRARRVPAAVDRREVLLVGALSTRLCIISIQ